MSDIVRVTNGSVVNSGCTEAIYRGPLHYMLMNHVVLVGGSHSTFQVIVITLLNKTSSYNVVIKVYF